MFGSWTEIPLHKVMPTLTYRLITGVLVFPGTSMFNSWRETPAHAAPNSTPMGPEPHRPSFLMVAAAAQPKRTGKFELGMRVRWDMFKLLILCTSGYNNIEYINIQLCHIFILHFTDLIHCELLLNAQRETSVSFASNFLREFHSSS